jgi:hypothetical protein
MRLAQIYQKPLHDTDTDSTDTDSTDTDSLRKLGCCMMS